MATILERVKKIIVEQLGVEDERVRLEWVSASEGDRFATIVTDMTEKIKRLGPFSRDGGGRWLRQN